LTSYVAADHVAEYFEGSFDIRSERKYQVGVPDEIRATDNQGVSDGQHRDDVTTNSAAPKKRVWAHGFDACLDLVNNDEENGTNKAEDNAESFALYAVQRELILAYPDLDVSVKHRKWIITRREKLLHHCLVHDCMRHKDAGSIREHPNYDPQKDSWGEHRKEAAKKCRRASANGDLDRPRMPQRGRYQAAGDAEKAKTDKNNMWRYC